MGRERCLQSGWETVGQWELRQTIKLWDPGTGEERRTLALPFIVTSIAFSPDGKLLASAGNDDTIRLWDPENGTELGEPILTSSLP